MRGEAPSHHWRPANTHIVHCMHSDAMDFSNVTLIFAHFDDHTHTHTHIRALFPFLLWMFLLQFCTFYHGFDMMSSIVILVNGRFHLANWAEEERWNFGMWSRNCELIFCLQLLRPNYSVIYRQKMRRQNTSATAIAFCNELCMHQIIILAQRWRPSAGIS